MTRKTASWLYLSAASILGLAACSKKKTDIDPVIIPVTTDTNKVVPVADPTTAATIGFFLNDWQSKSFTPPAYNEAGVPASTTGTVTIDASSIITKIPRSEFGHNAVTWMPSMNTETALVTHVTNLHPHIIRFPAGSGSDCYFWNRAPGSLPNDVPTMLTDKDGLKRDPGFMYGKTTETWRSSLDQYYSMLLQTGNQGILTVNYGYARYGTGLNPVAIAAHYAADWVRYDNGRTQYWEVGNENFGDWEWGYRIDQLLNMDGQPQYLTGQLYAQHFKVFADSMKAAAAEKGKTIYIGAVTAEALANQSWQTNTLKTWNSGMMANIAGKADFYVVHNYFTAYNTNSNASDIMTAAASVPSDMINYVTQTLQNNGAAVKPIALDEWNMFATGSKQQVSNISGIFSLLVMGEALKNKYGMAARWDMLNGWDGGNDHGLFSSGDEPGVNKWSPRPSFYYLYFFQKLLGDRLVPSTVQNANAITTYASTFSSGDANVTIINTSTAAQSVEVKFKNFKAGNRYYWYSLEGASDNGEFSRKVSINGNSTTADAGGPTDYVSVKANSASTASGVKITVPARGAVVVAIEKK
ncbi:MAG: alpha-L-arabinofuranosidase [Chitinophagaceae bacterium]